jgi:hypothetical protein
LDSSTTTLEPSLVKEVSEFPGCEFCAEQATIQTNSGINLCDIPGNHSEYDNEPSVRLVKLKAE